jgi:hypothetical protein
LGLFDRTAAGLGDLASLSNLLLCCLDPTPVSNVDEGDCDNENNGCDDPKVFFHIGEIQS